MKKIYYLLCSVFLIGMLLIPISCGKNSQSKEKDKKKDELVVPVEVAEVTRGNISAYFSGTATIEAEEETDVVAKVSGVVKKIYVEEGDYVKANQVVAKLDDEKLTVQLEQAKATLDKLENAYNRNDELFKKSLISVDQFQKSKYEYELKISLGFQTKLFPQFICIAP